MLLTISVVAVDNLDQDRYVCVLTHPRLENRLKGRITIDKEKCKGCGLCTLVCPMKQIEISDELNTKGYYPASFLEENAPESGKRKCTGCALCALMCPDVAIEVYRETKRPKSAQSNEDVSAVK